MGCTMWKQRVGRCFECFRNDVGITHCSSFRTGHEGHGLQEFRFPVAPPLYGVCLDVSAITAGVRAGLGGSLSLLGGQSPWIHKHHSDGLIGWFYTQEGPYVLRL